MNTPTAAPMREDVTQAAYTTLDVFLAAYDSEPDDAIVNADDDLLTWGHLRAILSDRLAHTARPDAGDDKAEIERLRGLLIDPGTPPWEDARAVLVAELRKGGYHRAANSVDVAHFADIPSHIALNLIAQAARRPDAGVDSATALFPKGTMYRSGHDGTGPDPSLFFCEAVSDAPECRRVRVVAETEAEARLQAAAALAPAAIASGREGRNERI